MNDNDNEDWIKTRTWDVRLGDGTLVETLPQLRRVLDMSDAKLRALPSMQVAPEAIRRALGLA